MVGPAMIVNQITVDSNATNARQILNSPTSLSSSLSKSLNLIDSLAARAADQEARDVFVARLRLLEPLTSTPEEADFIRKVQRKLLHDEFWEIGEASEA